MRALVLEQDKVVTVKDIPMPEKKTADSLLIKVVGSGICNSDIHRGFGGGAYHYPLVMGHEFSGIVEEAFSGSQYRKGDRVTVFPLLPCKKCIPCQSGDFAQCMDYDYFGSRCDGAFAEYVWVPEENLFPIPEHVDILHAAMTEPASVALHGVNRFSIKPNFTGMVIGGGPIGNMAAQWLKIRGCREVLMADVDEKKAELAERMGFVPVLSSKTDPVEFAYEYTKGNGIDCVIEACGFPSTFLQATKAAGRGGQVVFLGNIRGEFRIGEKDFSSILRRELIIYGTWNSKVVPRGKDDWSAVLSYMDKGLEVGALISHVVSLEDGPAVFDKIINKTEYISKVIFAL